MLSSASDTVIVEEDDLRYRSPVVTAMDLVDGDVSGSIFITDTVNIAVPGSYFVSYQARDAAGNVGSLTVIVRVVVGDRPIIMLYGASLLFHEAKTAFVDPLGNITDSLEPNLNQHLRSNASSAVDVNKLGIYTITYTMAQPDSQGYTAAPVTRVVIVRDTTPPVSA